jgi:hypothetical protein
MFSDIDLAMKKQNIILEKTNSGEIDGITKVLFRVGEKDISID